MEELNNKKNQKGFTIIEGLVAVFVITIAALIAYGSSQQVISYSRQSGDKFIAAYLAKEGIELVRNVRDSNWVTGGINWDNGLTGCSAGCEADRDTVLTTWSGTGNFLNFAGGYYDYGAGTATKFKRKITIDTSTADQLRVASLVSWKEGAIDKSITAEEILYNWR